MKKYYLDILKKLEENGFIAYIVGGFVRDQILEIQSEDIDIITNATPQELKKIWKTKIKTYDTYGAAKLKINNHLIDITTFRKELLYKNGKPILIEYTNSLEEDLKRRDFKMNTLCLDYNENIIDLLNGRQDIEEKIIKTVRDVSTEFEEDPSRMLRALRFMSELDFNLDQEIIDYISKRKETIKKINAAKIKEELDKLFKTKKVSRFLNFIQRYQLENYIGIKSNEFTETSSVIGVWAQLEITVDFPFTKYEKKNIKEIKELLKNKKITKLDLYKKGELICAIAGEILGIDKKELNLMYTNLPIKGIMDIEIKSEEICDILKIKPSKKLGSILKNLEKEIINGNLQNKKEDIVKWLIDSEVEHVGSKE